MYYRSSFRRRIDAVKMILIIIPAILTPACSPKNLSVYMQNKSGHTPLYIINASEPEPFYFEIGAGGPVLIASPAEASLNPFIPWPHSCHISYFLPVRTDEEDILYAAVNRSGILELRNSGKETAVYFYPGGETALNFTFEAFFCYNQKPAALFSSERFFSVNEQASPDTPLWILDNGILKPIIISAINTDKTADLETNAVFFGRDENWYIRKNRSGRETSYFRTVELTLSGQEIYAQQYLEAFSPLEANSPQVPALLAWALDEAGRLAGKPCIAAVVSPDFPAKRLFSSSPVVDENKPEGSEEFPVELSAYYRPSFGGNDALVVLLFPDGRGVYCRSDGTGNIDSHFTLPALPSGSEGSFVYTGVALLGDNPGIFLIAGWEEQKNWNVGAAGFLLLEIGW